MALPCWLMTTRREDSPQRVIRELVRSHAIYASGTVEITTGKRNVARITFDSALDTARA
jgi:hypothetical protein